MKSSTGSVLLVDCPDKPGLIYNITKLLFDRQLNITKTDEYVDQTTNHFFMRAEMAGEFNKDLLVEDVKQALGADSNVRLISKQKKDVVALVTKEHHAIGDLLIRHHSGELDANIIAVVGNHRVLEDLVTKFEIPFHYVDHKGIDRTEHEQQILDIIKPYNPDYLVLAKYMRILNPTFVANFKHRIVNIHHSFLPAFIGANPYRQAFNRGVKIIGATAHFVTDNLDEGPIIHQDIIEISHRDSARDMSRAGKDVEKIVLASALKLVFQDRVFIHGNKTVVF